MTVGEVAALLRGHRYAYRDEAQLQDALAAVLTAAGLPVEREARLTARDRVDVLTGRVGVEAKLAGSPAEVARQVSRYLESDRLDGLVLVTTRVRHLALTSTRKPFEVVTLAHHGL